MLFLKHSQRRDGMGRWVDVQYCRLASAFRRPGRDRTPTERLYSSTFNSAYASGMSTAWHAAISSSFCCCCHSDVGASLFSSGLLSVLLPRGTEATFGDSCEPLSYSIKAQKRAVASDTRDGLRRDRRITARREHTMENNRPHARARARHAAYATRRGFHAALGHSGKVFRS